MNKDSFHGHGSFGENAGWKVTVCVVGIGSISRPATPTATAAEKKTTPAADDNIVDPFAEIGGDKGNPNNPAMDDTADNGNKKRKRSKRQKSPMKLKYLVPLMKTAVTEWPKISIKKMTTILKPYIKFFSSPMHFYK